ncbi:MAG: 3-deoxy-D-manno-octulosonic acid transferase [Bacteroidota bacterium]|nr:3-deoxy-D-manno-octulosonic acid transferase [Bacteroidota bacterium]
MKVLYNISIFFLGLGLRVLSLFNAKARDFVTGRKEIFRKIREALGNNQSPIVWVHCASLGEFEQGRPVIEALKRKFPDHKIFLTFFSPSGYRVRKNYASADFVFYLPLDTKRNAKKFVTLVSPRLAIFIKYEFWYHYSRTLKKRKIPLISVSSIFRKDQFFFRKAGNFNRRILKSVTHFFVQNQQSVELLRSINFYNATVSGDTRFDRVREIVDRGVEIEIARKFKGGEKVMVVGSAWPEDIDVMRPFINEARLKFIIAPHEIHEHQLTALQRSLVVKSILYSQAEEANLEDASVLIIDNVGMLSSLYRYGEFAYIGGGLGKGLHNILEAACYGIPVLFGNRNYEKFQEAVDLINRGGAFTVADYPDLKKKYELLNTPETFLLACEVCRQYVSENTGATDRVMDYCAGVLETKPKK